MICRHMLVLTFALSVVGCDSDKETVEPAEVDATMAEVDAAMAQVDGGAEGDASTDPGDETYYCSFKCIVETQCLYNCSTIQVANDDESVAERQCAELYASTCGQAAPDNYVFETSIFECDAKGSESDPCACEYVENPGTVAPATGLVAQNQTCFYAGSEGTRIEEVQICQADGTMSIQVCEQGQTCECSREDPADVSSDFRCACQ